MGRFRGLGSAGPFPSLPNVGPGPAKGGFETGFTAPQQATVVPGGRRATPGDFGAGSGAALQNFGAAGQGLVDKLAEMQQADEVRKLKASVIEARTTYAEEMAAAEKSGEDFEKVNERHANKLNDLAQNTVSTGALNFMREQEALEGLKRAEATINATATREGAQVKNEAATATESLRAQAAANPTKVRELMAEGREYLSVLAPKTTPEHLEELNRQLEDDIISSAVDSEIRIDATGFIAKVEAGEWDDLLNAEEKAFAIKAAEAEQKRLETEARVRFNHEQNQKRAQSEEGRRGYQEELFADGADPADIMRRAAQDPTLTASDAQSVINNADTLVRRQSTGEVTTNTSAYRGVEERIYLPDGDPARITEADQIWEGARAGQYTFDDARRLEKHFNNRQRPFEIKRAQELAQAERKMATRLDTGLAASAAYEANREFDEEVERRNDAGEPTAPLLDPGSKEYWYSDERLRGYEARALGKDRTEKASKVEQERANALVKAPTRDTFQDPATGELRDWKWVGPPRNVTQADIDNIENWKNLGPARKPRSPIPEVTGIQRFLEPLRPEV